VPGQRSGWSTDPDTVRRQLCGLTGGGGILPAHWAELAPDVPLPPLCHT
jgi:hypothetical protein